MRQQAMVTSNLIRLLTSSSVQLQVKTAETPSETYVNISQKLKLSFHSLEIDPRPSLRSRNSLAQRRLHQTYDAQSRCLLHAIRTLLHGPRTWANLQELETLYTELEAKSSHVTAERSQLSSFLRRLKVYLMLAKQNLFHDAVCHGVKSLRLTSTAVSLFQDSSRDTQRALIRKLCAICITGYIIPVLQMDTICVFDKTQNSLSLHETSVESWSILCLLDVVRFLCALCGSADHDLIQEVLSQIDERLDSQVVPHFLSRDTPELNIQLESIYKDYLEFCESLNQLGLEPYKDSASLASAIKIRLDCRMFDHFLTATRDRILAWHGQLRSRQVDGAVMVLRNHSIDTEFQFPALPSSIMPGSAIQKSEAITEDDWGLADWDVEDTTETDKAPNQEIVHESSARSTNDNSHMVTTIVDELISSWRSFSTEHESCASRGLVGNSPEATRATSAAAATTKIYCSLIPFMIKKTGLPSLVVFNDCQWLLRLDQTHEVKQFGDKYYNLEIYRSCQAVLKIMNKLGDLKHESFPESPTQEELIISSLHDLLSRQQERYTSQLPLYLATIALASCVDTAFEYFLYRVLEMTDITMHESVRLAALGDSIARCVASISLLHAVTAGSSDKMRTLAKFQCLLLILRANLSELKELWFAGTMNCFNCKELTCLTRALFSPSGKREQLIAAFADRD